MMSLFVQSTHAFGASKFFDVPPGDAISTLKTFARQAELSILFTNEDLEGIRTQLIHGEYEILEAIRIMLQNTPLIVDQDEETGAFAVVLDPEAVTSKLSSGHTGGNPETANTNPSEKKLMNRKTNENRLVKWLAGFAAAFAAVTPATTVAQDDEDDILLLSPFVVNTSEDQGYLARSAQSGSRIDTPLSDVGAAISVVTQEFLEDTQSTNLRDVLIYTTGTEVTGFGGNFSNANISGGRPNETGLGNNPGTRLRGLASATLTRGFFRSDIPFDSYNSSRLEINRGANAILFGVGSPAGVINFTPNTASLDSDFGSGEFQFGRFDSYRFVFGYNKALFDGQAAVRVSILDDDTQFQQKPAFNRDQRGYVTTTISPDFLKTENGVFSGTTFRASYESGEIEANNPRSLPPNDRITTWFEPTAEMISAGIMPKYIHEVPQNFRPGLTQGTTVAQNLNRSPIVIFPDVNSAIAQDHRGGDLIGRQFVVNNSAVGGTSVHLAPTYLGDALRRSGNFPDQAFYSNPTINDRSIFDFRNILLDGDNKRENTDIQAYNLNLEQLFFENKAGIEIAFDSQTVETDNYALLSSGRPLLSIDINSVLLEGTPNPNFGRPYFSASAPSAGWGKSEQETFRFTAFGELDFETIYSDSWLKWLGRHVATVLYQDEEFQNEGRFGDPYYNPNPFPYANNQNRFTQSGKRIQSVHYVGDSLANANTASGANLSGLSGNRIATITQGGNFVLRRQAAGSDFEFDSIDIVRAQRDLSDNASGATKSLRVIESKAFNLQSYFLGGHIIGSWGIREEEVETSTVIAPRVTDGQNFRLVNDPSYAFGSSPDLETSAQLKSWSVVAKTPRGWLEPIPVISGLNFHYNESENFSPPSGTRFNAFGEQLLPPSGETKDYGFTLELLEGAAFLRVNWYETIQSLIGNSGITGTLNQVISIHQMAYGAVQDGFATDSDGDGFPDDYIAPPQAYLDLYDVQINNGTISSSNPGVTATGSAVSEGVEIELVLNPTDNWTVAINLAQQESIRGNTGSVAEQFLFNTPVEGGRSLVETWNELETVPLFITAVPGGSGTLADWTRRFIINPFNNVKLQDGSPAQELREWRFNAVTNYKFTEGKLAGFNMGGALRWQDDVAIGFPLTTAPDGSTIIDVTNPFFGQTETDVDLWLGYQRKIFDDKIDWKIQLNVRNAFQGDDLIPVLANPNGREVIFRNSASRTWTLSSKFSF